MELIHDVLNRVPVDEVIYLEEPMIFIHALFSFEIAESFLKGHLLDHVWNL